MNEVVISLCDITGTMVQPWVENGFDAILVDPQHPEGVTVEGCITKIGRIIDHTETWDILRRVIGERRVAFVACFPPCTDLAVSGARWFELKAAKDQAFQFKAMHVVWQCHAICEMIGAPYVIENPVGLISTLWRKPDHSFHPHEFTGYCADDNYTKKTMLWTGRGFTMPKPFVKTDIADPDHRIHTAAPGEDRANFRSATPLGFAKAVFYENCL